MLKQILPLGGHYLDMLDFSDSWDNASIRRAHVVTLSVDRPTVRCSGFTQSMLRQECPTGVPSSSVSRIAFLAISAATL